MNTAPKFATIATALLQAVVWICALKLSAGTVAAQCTSTSSVPNQTISSGTVCYSNNDTLTAAAVTVNGSADVRFLAGQRVNLTPGFRATAGTAATTFHAWVEAVPSAVWASPSGGTGLTQAFTWTVSNPEGYGEIDEVQAIFGATLGGWGRCYIRYSRASNLLYLTDDSEVTWLGGFAPGTHGTANNSRCAVTGSGASVHGSGTHLAVTVPVTFQAGWAGVKNQYLNVYDMENLSSGWQTMGTWTVGGGGTYALTTAASPVPGGTVSPGSGSYGSGSVVTVTAAAANGYSFVNWTGNVATASSATTTVTMSASESIVANFSQTGCAAFEGYIDYGTKRTSDNQLEVYVYARANRPGWTAAVYAVPYFRVAGAASGSAMETYIGTHKPVISNNRQDLNNPNWIRKYALSDRGPGMYWVLAKAEFSNANCPTVYVPFPLTQNQGYGQSPTRTVKRPVITGLPYNNSLWYFGPNSPDQFLTSNGYDYFQYARLSVNKNCEPYVAPPPGEPDNNDVCNSTPNWTSPKQKHTTLSCSSCFTPDLRSSDVGECNFDDSVRVEIGGFASDAVPILVNSPTQLVKPAAPTDYTEPWENGYTTHWHWVVADACTPANALLSVPFHEVIGQSNLVNAVLGWTSTPANATGLPNFNVPAYPHVFDDQLGVRDSTTANLPAPLLPPPLQEQPVGYLWDIMSQTAQQWYIGSDDYTSNNGSNGVLVYSGTIRLYRNHGESTKN